eukprot:gene6406-7675_t
MRPLTISPHELRDNGLACGTRCAYAACCPSAAYYALRNQVDVYVTRDTPAAEMHETRRVLALMGAALSMCNPIASHWLHVHERQRVRSAVEATGPTVQDDPRACADHTAVCACYPCAYEQESRLILDISSPILRLARADMRAMRKFPPHAVLLKLAEMRHARMAAYVKRNRENMQNSPSGI